MSMPPWALEVARAFIWLLPIPEPAKDVLLAAVRAGQGIGEAINAHDADLAKRRLLEATFLEIDNAVAKEKLRARHRDV